MGIQLRVADTETFHFDAGQYLLLVLSDKDKRPFSIASSPTTLPYIDLQIRSIKDNFFTQQILQKLQNSKFIDIEGPFGQCLLDNSDSNPVVFIVGGTGFAPAKSMLEHFLENNPHRQFSLFWGAKTKEDLYQTELPLLWQNKFSHFEYHPVVSEPNDEWQGAKGLVHNYAIQHLSTLSKTEFYLAGSSKMVLAVFKDLLNEGVKENHIHSDMLDILREQDHLDDTQKKR